jgi:hypothetical protein
MPKKITNPLRSGLPSKIYLAAYGKPISGYEIAQRVYGITSAPSERAQIPPTAKIYGWLKKLEKDGLVKKLDGGYLSHATPLISEIEKTLEVHTAKGLTAVEKKILIKILDSGEFRSYVGERTSKIDLRGDVDAAREISERLVVPFLVLKILRTEIKNPEVLELREPTTIGKFDEFWSEDILEVLKGKFRELLKETKPSLEGGSAPYQKRKKESSLERDFEMIMSRAKDSEGLLALKFACVPAQLSEEIVNLSPVAVAAKRVLDGFKKKIQK